MGSIRHQTIVSSILVYLGFLVGALNTYFYVTNGSFTPEQFGLTRIFFDFGQNMYIFSSLGIIPVIYKFYPYYKDNLPAQKIDIVTWAMGTALTGFIILLVAGFYFQPLIVHAYQQKSPLIVDFYYLMFPFALGMLLFSVLEAYCWAIHQTIISNFLKETVMRIVTTVFILLFYFKIISFNTFVWLFTFLYAFIFIVLVVYLRRRKQLYFPFQISRVTKKFRKKMLSMQAFIFGGTLISSIAATVDSVFIAHFQDLVSVGIFGLSQYAANLVQVPQRSIQAIATGYLAKAWKDKDYKEINRIYVRSCINLLLLALFIFGNIWLNVSQGMEVLHVQNKYQSGLGVLFILGMARIIDAGTGVNNVVINTSTYWKFDFNSGVILLTLRLPLTWFLIKHYGIIGSAIGELASYTIYNFIRFEFLRRKFQMQPFNGKTVIAILLGFAAFFISFFLFNHLNGWTGILFRSAIFSILFIVGIFIFKLTPDAHQLFEKWMRKNK